MEHREPLADPDDLATWIGEPIDDAERARLVLRYASSLVREETGRTWDEEAASTSVPETVSMVTLQVAGRGYLNPESWSNESVDDWRGGGRPVEEQGMYLTQAERSLLAQYRPRKPRGIGVMTLSRDLDPAPTSGLVPTPDGQPIPWY